MTTKIIMDYAKKYMKYKQKYLSLKKYRGGAIINFFTCFLWINKKQQVIPDNIKKRLLRIINLFKHFNPQSIDKIFLYFDFNLTEQSDIDFFSKIVSVKNIWELTAIATNFKLQRLFLPDIPVYVRVDICKIILMYEVINQKDQIDEVTYVVMPDIDLLQKEDKRGIDYENRLICGEGDLEDFSMNQLFDAETLKLLDLFGMVMAKNGEMMPPENGFMIAKNDKEYLNAVKKYFIEILFQNIIYEFVQNHNDNLFKNKIHVDYNYYQNISFSEQFLYQSYRWFFGYLNLIKQYHYFYLVLDTIDLRYNEKAIKQKQYLDSINYKKIAEDDKGIFIVTIENEEDFWLVHNSVDRGYFFKYYDTDSHSKLGAHCEFTEKGKHILSSNIKAIYPYYLSVQNDRVHDYMTPTKCVKLESSNTH